MPVTATTSEEISVGAGDVFYRDAGDTDGAWTSVGATQDENVFRILQEFFAPQFNGVVGPIKGTHYLSTETVELEVSIPQLSAALAAILIPTSESETDTSAEVSGGGSGGLDAAITAGQTTAIKLSSVTGLAVGDFIKVVGTSRTETRQLIRVGTAGVGGTGVDVDFPFIFDHPDTDTFVEVDGTGNVSIRGGDQRRVPSDRYKDIRLDVPGLDGRMTRFFIYNALALGDKEFSAEDDDNMKPRVTFTGTRDGATPQTSAWEIVKQGAAA